MAQGSQHRGQRPTAADWLAEVRRHEREGDLFQAYDLAMQGLARFPSDIALQHRAVVCLASTRATSQASELFSKLGLEPTEAKTALVPPALRLDIACLQGRLRKDAALAAQGMARQSGLAAAAELYEAAYRREAAAGNAEAYYPGVNAATLWLLADERADAIRLANAVLTELGAVHHQDGYYKLVSAAEAHLVLGLSLIHISEPTRQAEISYAVFCLK